MNFDAIKDILLSEAKRAGLDKYDVYFMEAESNGAETLKDEISSFSISVSGGVCFRCVVDGRLGSASTELLDEREMRALVDRAVANAKNIESDDEAIIFKGSEHYESIAAKPFEMPDTAKIKRVALELQNRTYSLGECVSDGTQSGVFSEKFSISFLNSNGLNLSHSSGSCGAYVQAVVCRDGESQEAFDFCEGLEGEALSALPGRVYGDALSKLNAGEVESGEYDIIFSAKQMRALLSTYSSVFSARNAQLGLSLLKGKEGEKIAADCVTVADDPFRAESGAQIAFDGEGVATYTKKVIEKGTLNTLLYDLSAAKKAGREASTGNGQRTSYAEAVNIRPFSFYIEAGKCTEEELFAKVENGIFVTEMKGLHAGANSITGDFSIESAGFMIRDGKKAEAVHSFTVAGNFFELLKNIEALGDAVSFGMSGGFTSFGAPNTLVRKMSVAGK